MKIPRQQMVKSSLCDTGHILIESMIFTGRKKWCRERSNLDTYWSWLAWWKDQKTMTGWKTLCRFCWLFEACCKSFSSLTIWSLLFSVNAFLLCAHNRPRECFLAHVAIMYVPLIWCRTPHVCEREQKVLQGGFDVAFFYTTQLASHQKQQFFSLLSSKYMMRPIVPRPVSHVGFLLIPQP